MPITWHGEEIAARIRAASVAAIDDTLNAAVEYAKAHHEFEDQSGYVESDIQAEPARPTATGAEGRWGDSARGAIDLELGNVQTPPMPFLRPAADATYPMLPDAIRKHLE